MIQQNKSKAAASSSVATGGNPKSSPITWGSEAMPVTDWTGQGGVLLKAARGFICMFDSLTAFAIMVPCSAAVSLVDILRYAA